MSHSIQIHGNGVAVLYLEKKVKGQKVYSALSACRSQSSIEIEKFINTAIIEHGKIPISGFKVIAAMKDKEKAELKALMRGSKNPAEAYQKSASRNGVPIGTQSDTGTSKIPRPKP